MRIRDHEDVAPELVLVLGSDLGHGLSVVLLVALDDELDVHGEPAAPLDHRFHPRDLGVMLPLVVVGATGPDGSILDPRLEGRMLPELDGIHGLDVDVTVDQHRGGAWIDDPLREEARVGAGRPDLGLESE